MFMHARDNEGPTTRGGLEEAGARQGKSKRGPIAAQLKGETPCG